MYISPDSLYKLLQNIPLFFLFFFYLCFLQSQSFYQQICVSTGGSSQSRRLRPSRRPSAHYWETLSQHSMPAKTERKLEDFGLKPSLPRKTKQRNFPICQTLSTHNFIHFLNYESESRQKCAQVFLDHFSPPTHPLSAIKVNAKCLVNTV